MKNFLAYLAVGVLLVVQASLAAPSLDEIVQSELDAAGLPGVSYAIIDHGTSISGASGQADLGSGRAVTPHTPFRIGSISKSFTAVAIMQLMEAGKVNLDGEISLYLAGFDASPARGVTIRQLLGHTSGYSTLQGNTAHVDSPESEDALSRQVDQIAKWSPAFEPGSQFDYSNANYILLGGVIEAVSGLKYDQYVKMKILEPLGMKDSLVSDGGTYPGVAVGHTPWFGKKRPFREEKTSRAGAPAGGIMASADDLALYVAMLLNGKDDIISAESKKRMMQPASSQSPFYGLGWALSPQEGAVYHSGTSPGTETFAILLPDESKAVIVLVNAGSGMGFGETGNLIHRISAYGLGQDYTPDQGIWGRKSLFLMYALLPLIFMAGTVQAWLFRSGVKAKSGAAGAFSLWFPLLMTSALAWISLSLVPSLFGITLTTLKVFSPDFSIALLASSTTGLVWAVSRLIIHYSARLTA